MRRWKLIRKWFQSCCHSHHRWVATHFNGSILLSVFLSLLDRPELSFNAVKSEESKHIHAGDTLSLSCPFKNFNQFQWLKNGSHFNNKTIDIELNKISRSDGGECYFGVCIRAEYWIRLSSYLSSFVLLVIVFLLFFNETFNKIVFCSHSFYYKLFTTIIFNRVLLNFCCD